MLRISDTLSLPLDYVTKTAAILAQRRKGKRLWVETPLPTPTGWTTMGAVEVGDLLLDETGSPCAVTEVHPVEWGDAYRVRFSDGEEIVADAEHLWLTWTRAERLSAAQRRPGGEARWGRPQCRPALPQVRTTSAIRSSLLVARTDGRTERNHSVPTTSPLDLPEVELPVDPYLLGVWLGDGTTTAGVITTADAQIVEEISRRGYEVRVQPSTVGHSKASGYRIVGLQPTLRSLGVLGHKHVPSSYHRASFQQRLDLVQGLMDSDGGWTLTQAQFAVTSEELADDLYELVVSLGMKAVRSKRPARLNGIDHGTAYSVKFSPTLPVFRLGRKADKLRTSEVTPAASRRFVAAVEPTVSVPMRCIAVDSPSNLFLAGTGMVPTHNSYTAAVIAEEFVAARQPFVILDPTGAHWGLRASADGESEGLPVVILGGQHGDIPLERTDGRFVAELVVDEPGFYVIDFSLFESGAAEKQFATDFAKHLYRRKAQPNSDFALHLLVDEADRFVPQRITDRREGDAAMLGAFETIVRRGGLRGLGTTLISQRAAVINKNVLEQIDVLILLRTVGPNDQKAVEGYINAFGTAEQKAELLGSLASLDLGEAWVWEPGGDPPLFERVRIRARRTFNSSATPKPGERRVEPRRLAAVDLAAIKDRMAETIERAKADDPVELRRRIKELELDLSQVARSKPEVVVERVEVPVLDEALVLRLAELLQPVADVLGEVQGKLRGEGWPTAVAAGIGTSPGPGGTTTSGVAPVGATSSSRRRTGSSSASTSPPEKGPSSPSLGGTARIRGGLPKSDESGSRQTPAKLAKAERLILTALAEHPDGRTKLQLAFLSGYHSRSKGFINALSSLKTAGYVTVGDLWVITDSGVAALGPYERPGDPVTYWMAKLGLAERGILQALLDIYPKVLDNVELAALTPSTTGSPYHPRSKGFLNALSRLRSLGLIEGPRGFAGASEELFG